MFIRAIPAGIYDANCYIIMDENTKEGLVLDPGGDEDMLLSEIRRIGVDVKGILLTHGHVDHVSGVDPIAKALNAPVYIHKLEEEYMAKDNYVFGNIKTINHYLKDGEELTFGSIKVKVISTPGHTKGGVSFLINDMLFTGDTLFQSSIGRSDFLGGDFKELIDSIKTKLLPLGDKIVVYPGHGPSSTIGNEKAYNMYLNDYNSLI